MFLQSGLFSVISLSYHSAQFIIGRRRLSHARARAWVKRTARFARRNIWARSARLGRKREKDREGTPTTLDHGLNMTWHSFVAASHTRHPTPDFPSAISLLLLRFAPVFHMLRWMTASCSDYTESSIQRIHPKQVRTRRNACVSIHRMKRGIDSNQSPPICTR